MKTWIQVVAAGSPGPQPVSTFSYSYVVASHEWSFSCIPAFIPSVRQIPIQLPQSHLRSVEEDMLDLSSAVSSVTPICMNTPVRLDDMAQRIWVVVISSSFRIDFC